MSAPDNMVLILACSKLKADVPRCKAGDLYRGQIFLKGKAIANAAGLPFWILSAKYGFITPEQEIDNYDEKFKKPFRGPFPPAPWHGFYLGGQLYFRNIPESFLPLVPSQQMGYMLRALTDLQGNPERVRQMICEHPGA